jgi:hypothetical protein
MSGYIEAGYIIAFSVLGTYATSVVVRERAAGTRLRRRNYDATRAGSPAGRDKDAPVGN